jgi:predicted DNA-binding transcriptional regulator YafY
VSRTDRLYAIVEELRARAPRPLPARRLAETFEVSVRTIERDLAQLSMAGVPIWTQPGPGGGYAVNRDTTLPPLNLTAAEATALMLSLAQTRDMPFGTAGRSALRKLVAAMSEADREAARGLAGRVRLATYEDFSGPPAPTLAEAAVQREVERAVTERRALGIEYCDRHGVATERVVEPAGVVGTRGGWYLVAWCRMRDGGRAFRLDRIGGARVLDERIEPRPLEEMAGGLKLAPVLEE